MCSNGLQHESVCSGRGRTKRSGLGESKASLKRFSMAAVNAALSPAVISLSVAARAAGGSSSSVVTGAHMVALIAAKRLRRARAGMCDDVVCSLFVWAATPSRWPLGRTAAGCATIMQYGELEVGVWCGVELDQKGGRNDGCSS